MKNTKLRTGLLAGLGALAVTGALVAPATAAGPYSTLVTSDADNALTLDLANTVDNPVVQTITVKLDDATCFASLSTKGQGQSYGIAVTFPSQYVNVTPALVNDLKCSSPATTFTVTGVAVTPVGTPASILFDAVGKNSGIGRKLGDVTVAATVIDTGGLNPQCGPGAGQVPCPPTDLGVPAAPAVANAYINSTVAADCKRAMNNAKNWRGLVIQQVTDWMPKPESVKNTWAADHAGQTWEDYVTAQVDTICPAASA